MGLFLVKEILAITGISIRETGISGPGSPLRDPGTGNRVPAADITVVVLAVRRGSTGACRPNFAPDPTPYFSCGFQYRI